MTDRRRRQKEQRAAKLQAEKKKKARKELARRLAIALGFGVMVIAILTIGSIFGSDEVELPSTYQRYRDQPTACDATQPPPETPATFQSAEEQPDLDTVATATIVTSCGPIVIELDVEDSPATVNSFVFLARQGFYNGQVFHRVLADFVVHGGDPEANGSGGPGYRVEDEFPDGDFVYTDGIVAMDNSGKGTTGSEFFIVIGPNASVLNPTFNVLGTVVSGHETLAKISQVDVAVRPGSNERSVPLQTVYIETVTIDSAS